MADNPAAQAYATAQRRKSGREEFATQAKLAELLAMYVDPATTFWSGLENKPRSRLSGLLQKRRGVKAGLTDVLVIYRDPERGVVKPIFLELKSRRGVASEAQKKIRTELLASGAAWWLARSASAALQALRLEGVVFRYPWEPAEELEAWEGPFADPTQRLPQHPEVAAERAAARRRWRERQASRARETISEPPRHPERSEAAQ